MLYEIDKRYDKTHHGAPFAQRYPARFAPFAILVLRFAIIVCYLRHFRCLCSLLSEGWTVVSWQGRLVSHHLSSAFLWFELAICCYRILFYEQLTTAQLPFNRSTRVNFLSITRIFFFKPKTPTQSDIVNFPNIAFHFR